MNDKPSKEEMITTNRGNTIHITHHFPSSNNVAVVQTLAAGMAYVGLFDGVLKSALADQNYDDKTAKISLQRE